MAGGYWRIGNDNTKYDAASGKYYCVTNPVNLYGNNGEYVGKFTTEKTIKIDFKNPYFYDDEGNITQLGMDCVCDIPFTNIFIPLEFDFAGGPRVSYVVEFNFEESNGKYIAYVIFKVISK